MRVEDRAACKPGQKTGIAQFWSLLRKKEEYFWGNVPDGLKDVWGICELMVKKHSNIMNIC